jgi:mono/diheme cytochrome c family protein
MKLKNNVKPQFAIKGKIFMKSLHVFLGLFLVAIVMGVVKIADVFPSEIAPLTQLDRAGISNEQIELGENLTLLGDCSSCHKRQGVRGLIGGVALPTPFGTIYSTNITPDLKTGIGSWSYEAFERSMRHGIDREGNHLYPAFPFDHFAATTDEDLSALYTYLMAQDPIASDRMPNKLQFPFSIRPILAGWKLLFHRPEPFVPYQSFTEEENRGAYLAETLGHCSGCHSPRNIFGAVKQNEFLAGGDVEGWIAPPLGKASLSMVGWDIKDFEDYLFDGWSEKHGIAAGPMKEVVDNLYDANEDDVFAIAAWLAKITPPSDNALNVQLLNTISALDLSENFDFTFAGKNISTDILDGAQIFKNNCLKCHKERLSKEQPISLGLTFAVNAQHPTNLFNAILRGIEPPAGSSARRMQAISLPSDDLEKLAKFIRFHFSNQQPWGNIKPEAIKVINTLSDQK